MLKLKLKKRNKLQREREGQEKVTRLWWGKRGKGL